MRILALDLGKYKTVYDSQTGAHRGTQGTVNHFTGRNV